MSQAGSGEENQDLRRRLEEAEETLRAIQSGEVDALVVAGSEGNRIYTLQGADHPYRALIESMQQGAVSLSVDGTILYCNSRFAEMLRRPHEKVIGAVLADLLPASQRPAFLEILRKGHVGVSQGELEFQTADGQIMPVYLSLAPLPLPDSLALCLVVTDLTDQKKHKDLQETNQRKDEFLAMLAHELRNPLAPIRNAVAILQHLEPGDANLTYAREIIARQVQHLSRLVDDLLDVSRLTLSKVKLKKEPVPLAEVLTRAVETSKPLLDDRKHRLSIALPAPDVRVHVDPTRLAQVVSNLLTNAAKYTDEGGEIALASAVQGAQAVIRVRDNGMGIAPDLLPHVFDLFIQGDRSLARSEGGLGIGLTLVRRLVEMHEGSVRAHSAGPGQGSEFVIALPLLRDGKESDQVPKSSAGTRSAPSPSLHVLVVDDNRDGADSLAFVLRYLGHRVRIVYNGPDAVEAAQADRPHALLLDIGLPGMNGYEVAQQLQQTPGFEKTLLIAMTGYGQEEDRERSLQAGFHHHLVKPIDLEQLKALLAAIEVPTHSPMV